MDYIEELLKIDYDASILDIINSFDNVKTHSDVVNLAKKFLTTIIKSYLDGKHISLLSDEFFLIINNCNKKYRRYDASQHFYDDLSKIELNIIYCIKVFIAIFKNEKHFINETYFKQEYFNIDICIFRSFVELLLSKNWFDCFVSYFDSTLHYVLWLLNEFDNELIKFISLKKFYNVIDDKIIKLFLDNNHWWWSNDIYKENYEKPILLELPWY